MGRREIRYVRSGQRVYLGGASRIGDSWAKAEELAWDGEFEWSRKILGELVRRSERLKNVTIATVPEDFVVAGMNRAYGLKSVAVSHDPWPRDYELVSAGRDEGDSTVQIEMKSKSGQLIRAWHDPAQGYQIVRLERATEAGEAYHVLDRIEYAVFGDAGNRVYFPVAARMRTTRGDVDATTEMRVDVKTLRVNQEVDPNVFTLTAFPMESVLESGSGRTLVAAKDASWDPRGRVAFPWTTEAEFRAQAGLSAGAGAGTAVLGSDRPVRSEGERGGGSGRWLLLMGAGVMLAASVVFAGLLLRNRRVS